MLLGGGVVVKLGGVQIALFKLRGPNDALQWYAVQNLCPHDERQVLSRGLSGDLASEAKVACPMHKNNFSLLTGEHLAGGSSRAEWTLETFPVKEVAGEVFLEFDTERLTPPLTEALHEASRGRTLPN